MVDTVWAPCQDPLTYPSPSCGECWLLIAHSCPLLKVAIFSKQEYFILSGKLYLFSRQLSLIDGSNLQPMTDMGFQKSCPLP